MRTSFERSDLPKLCTNSLDCAFAGGALVVWMQLPNSTSASCAAKTRLLNLKTFQCSPCTCPLLHSSAAPVLENNTTVTREYPEWCHLLRRSPWHNSQGPRSWSVCHVCNALCRRSRGWWKSSYKQWSEIHTSTPRILRWMRKSTDTFKNEKETFWSPFSRSCDFLLVDSTSCLFIKGAFFVVLNSIYLQFFNQQRETLVGVQQHDC